MRLGVSYNFFNGEEHLIASLRSVRSSAAHINVIFQRISNSGNPATAEASARLQDACNQGLVDHVHLFEPDLRAARSKNELSKRRQGMKLSRIAGCSHFLCMDADEFYRHTEIEFAKRTITDNGYTITTVNSFFHLRRPIYRTLDTTNVAFICRLNLFTRIGSSRYPAQMIDPTRQISTFPRRHCFFSSDSVAMYHMNFVRHDFASKFKNSSTTDSKFLENVETEIRSWEFPNPFNFPGKQKFHMDLVENEFAAFDPADAPPHDS
jgi:hypothetical protein